MHARAQAGGRVEEEGESQADALLSVKPATGFDATTHEVMT